MRRALQTFLAVLLVAGMSGAAAQLRSIPEDAKRAQMRHVQDMLIELDGAKQRLAPGAQIRDASNRLIVPTALPEGAQVKYRLDAQDQVRQMWILTPEEASKP